ncbi:hypothetical protein FB451DRAFT_1175851 [Mycena latifolia]|nr:hypothetical protein FB451DRAFT_1175851 [Mycena latifolia]
MSINSYGTLGADLESPRGNGSNPRLSPQSLRAHPPPLREELAMSNLAKISGARARSPMRAQRLEGEVDKPLWLYVRPSPLHSDALLLVPLAPRFHVDRVPDFRVDFLPQRRRARLHCDFFVWLEEDVDAPSAGGLQIGPQHLVRVGGAHRVARRQSPASLYARDETTAISRLDRAIFARAWSNALTRVANQLPTRIMAE